MSMGFGAVEFVELIFAAYIFFNDLDSTEWIHAAGLIAAPDLAKKTQKPNISCKWTLKFRLLFIGLNMVRSSPPL